MIVRLHKGQYQVATDKTRFRIVVAGRRWGKSVLSRMIVYKWALEDPGLYWIVSPTYQQGKDIHWLQGFKNELLRVHIKKWNDAELTVYLKNGSVISLRSAEHPDRLVGVKLKGLIVDEIASMRNWDWIWMGALRPTLTDYQAKALFISTPKGLNHFFTLAKLGDHANKIPGNAITASGDAVAAKPDYKSWQFTSYDNPYIKKVEIDQAKSQLNADYFAQEYLADFRKYTGIVYKDFDRSFNVINPFYIPEEWQRYRTMDFGSTNPTAVLWIAVSPEGDWIIYDEHYVVNLTIDYHAGIINTKSGSDQFVSTFGDPSGKVWIEEFAQQPRNIYITPATRDTGTNLTHWVRFGIDKVGQQLVRRLGRRKITPDYPPELVERGLPALYVFKHCTNLIHEFETYRWKERRERESMDINQPDMPEKANDHALDALRYFAVSYRKQEAWKPGKEDLSLKNWSLI